MSKKTFLSGIQPTNIPHIGNYFGAIKNWVGSQEAEGDDALNSFYFLADLHAITVRQDPADFEKKVMDCFALFLAAGLDPERSTLFVQSHVPEHTELSWILSCYAQFGELSRMTQFKDKSANQKEGEANIGLFSYPVLQAADILIYQANFVPVGKDQKQHLELARNIAQRFNKAHGETFVLPEPFKNITQNTAKIMSLLEPLKKMSKSDANPGATISLLDDRDTVIKKFKRAVTDSEAKVEFREGDPEKAGVNNLMTIYGAATGKSMKEIEKELDGLGYGVFKAAVGESVADMLLPIQEAYNHIRDDRAYIEICMKNGAEKASAAAAPTLAEVKAKVGFLQFKDTVGFVGEDRRRPEMRERRRFIDMIEVNFRNDEKVNALWLEGADALNRADGFSDLDFWFDVEDGFEEATLEKCEKIISRFGKIDFVDYEQPYMKVFKRIFHIKNISEFFLIEVCVQSHSRGKTGTTFYADDIAEFPLILFDKANVVNILPPEQMSKTELKPVFDRCVSRYNRRPRLLKQIKRGRFIEAANLFEEYVRFPIICMLRLVYTPRHYEYGYINISEHFPRKIVSDLESLYRVQSVKDIEGLLEKADRLYYEVYNALKEILN